MSQIIEVVERYILPDFPDIELPEEDGVPLESNWHRIQINLLIDIVTERWKERQDFFADRDFTRLAPESRAKVRAAGGQRSGPVVEQ